MTFWRSLAVAYDDLYRSLRPFHGRLAEISAILCDGPRRTGHSLREVIWARDDAHAAAFEMRRLLGTPEEAARPVPVQKQRSVPTAPPALDWTFSPLPPEGRIAPATRAELAEAAAAITDWKGFTDGPIKKSAVPTRISLELNVWAALTIAVVLLGVVFYGPMQRRIETEAATAESVRPVGSGRDTATRPLDSDGAARPKLVAESRPETDASPVPALALAPVVHGPLPREEVPTTSPEAVLTLDPPSLPTSLPVLPTIPTPERKVPVPETAPAATTRSAAAAERAPPRRAASGSLSEGRHARRRSAAEPDPPVVWQLQD